MWFANKEAECSDKVRGTEVRHETLYCLRFTEMSLSKLVIRVAETELKDVFYSWPRLYVAETGQRQVDARLV